MKKLLLFVVIILAFTASQSQSLFQYAYGTDPINSESFTHSPDAFYLWQDVTMPVFGSYLYKVDLNGSLLWKKEVNFSTAIGIFKIHYHNNNLYLTGGHQNLGYKNFFAKLDTAGNILWTTEISYGDININTRILPLGGGGFLTAGHRDYIGSQSAYNFDITLSRFDDSGNLVWAKAIGNSSYEFTCNAAVLTTNDDLITAGNYGFRTPPSYDPMIARFDSSGNLLWMKYYEDTTGFFTKFYPTDMVATSDGNFVLTGFSENTNFNNDPQIIKINGNGDILWAKRLYQISWQEYGLDIMENSQGFILVAGNYQLGTSKGNFFVTLDQAGNMVGSIGFNGTAGELNSFYDPHGGHLAELPGFGYAYGTTLMHTVPNAQQCIITGDYIGTFSCTGAVLAYPFTIQNATWVPTSFTSLPASSGGITGTPVTFTSSVNTGSQADICQFVGADELTTVSISKNIYPNPVIDELKLKWDNLPGIYSISIINATGRLVYLEKSVEINSAFKINTAGLTSGIYNLRISGENKVMNQKFIKAQP